MAKTAKTGRAAKQAGVRPVTTRDERDVKDTRTATERRKDEQAEKDQRRKPSAQTTGEEVDNEQLPLNHQTITDHRDVEAGKLPPEATPREGKTAPYPPLSPGHDVRQARSTELEEAGESPITDRSRIVQATQLGYYDDARRRPGDVFGVRPEEFSSRWMRDAPRGSRPSRPTTANQAIAQQNALTRNARAAGQGGFPSAPNAETGITQGIDQREEHNPLDD